MVGLEANGSLYVVALRDDGGVALVASMPSGLDAVMEVVWSTARRGLWALCDNTCGGSAAVLRPSAGSFVLSVIVEPPPGMASLNNEGFALGPSCVDDKMAAIWADDAASAGHVLREATLGCAAIASGVTAPERPAIASRATGATRAFATFVGVAFAHLPPPLQFRSYVVRVRVVASATRYGVAPAGCKPLDSPSQTRFDLGLYLW